ncbi:MAG: transcription factor S, partial [Nanoarchaeota archaeon]|nr:transcription factor S [Nanoarchaeota archaeon]
STKTKLNVLKEKGVSSKIILVVDEDLDKTLPKTKAHCPKCGNGEAYYWLKQTRSPDEPPTTFFKCVKCKKIWREY